MTIEKLQARIVFKNDTHLDCTCVGEEQGDAELFKLFVLSYLDMGEARRVVFYKEGKILETYTLSGNGRVKIVDYHSCMCSSYTLSTLPAPS